MSLLRRLALLLAFLFLAPALHAQDVLPVPALTARVVDQTATLNEAQRSALEAKLAAFEAQAGPQIVVLLVPSTAPEDIASFAQRVGESWKIGRREVGDGLLIVVAKNDRKLWIAPAKALEGAVPDLAARQIVQNTISPAFKQGDYAGGLNAGIDALMARIQGENLPAPQAKGSGSSSGSGLGIEELLMFFFVGVPIIGSVLNGIFGRKLGSLLTSGAAGGMAWWLTQSLLLAGAAGVVTLIVVGIIGVGSALKGATGHRGGRGSPVIWGGGHGGGGGWSGGGGGGGFSSGGGGDFGGGGAGGDW
jgi:uncharacterized protein